MDQPIWRPAPGRLRECQGVSGVLNKHERRVVLLSQSVMECHGADVKTVDRTKALQREAADRMEAALTDATADVAGERALGLTGSGDHVAAAVHGHAETDAGTGHS